MPCPRAVRGATVCHDHARSEPIVTNHHTILPLLREAIDAKRPAAVATIVRGDPLGAKLLVLPDRTVGTLGSPTLDERVVADARSLLETERSATNPYDLPDRAEVVEVFIETFPPPPLLLI